ncbi:hypothetical protein GF402_02545 [Candidatus Fermentibacteria bacterium]|nr:hypothetical protein [Candidatus Fermentibacteria bacterium]
MSSIALILTLFVVLYPPTNLELTERAVTEACSGLPSQLKASSIDTLSLQMEGNHQGGWLVDQTAVSLLTEEGLTIMGSTSEENSYPILKLRPMDLGVRYGDVSRAWLVGTKKVERVASCELSATALDAHGHVLMSVRLSATVSDEVPHSDLSRLAGSEQETWLGSGIPEEGGTSLLEPLVVSGVVASLIYLFYSSRAE